MTTTTTSARALLDSAISEKAFQTQVIRLAELNNWLVYHTWNSQHSAAGFPDLVLVRHGCIVFAELKSQKGRVSPEQHVWIQALSLVAGIVSAAGVIGGVRVFLWRPSDWPIIERVLAGNSSQRTEQEQVSLAAPVVLDVDTNMQPQTQHTMGQRTSRRTGAA